MTATAPAGGSREVPLVAVAHGSADERSAQAVERLVARVRHLRPGLEARVAYLDHVTPDPQRAVKELAGDGAGEVVILPTLLTAAYHSKVDLPGVIEQIRATYPWLRIHYGATLGPHPLLPAGVERRLAQVGVTGHAGTGLVVAAAGSSDADANAVIASMAQRLAERGPWSQVVPAYASAAEPTPGAAVRRLHEVGIARVAVATYLLAPGFFADRIAEQAHAAGAAAVSPALGDCPELAAIVLQRYDEARAATPHVEHTAAP
ncbi:sirohydrochlorin chelatase [Salinactinospora qingdaonensis]|uniref:Sirohydrochlorin chelatase n=1 Tax=Salinactinospora qingdaonensis TaxID=702744 RepID=A0ABP7F0L8_9ACTN